MTTVKRHFIKTRFMDIDVYTCSLQVKHVVHISYVAVRGKDEVEGAVQRVLNPRRIANIKEFILNGNRFFNTFILNWTDEKKTPSFSNNEINIPITPAAAQMIDGQHRLEGLRHAMEASGTIGEQEILVSVCLGLTTKQAAKIFLNINSEQRPVPKSLIYDLFGEVEDDLDHVINRAKDIANELNDNEDSPYYRAIKYPGTPRGVGFLDLSTVVSALKPHLSSEGVFAQNNLRSLNYQKLAVMNYFKAIRSFYDKDGLWTNRSKNPFFRSSGFSGAVDYFASTLLAKCADKRSFSESTFKNLLNLDSYGLLTHEEIKHLDGKTARKRISEFLNKHQQSSLPNQNEFQF